MSKLLSATVESINPIKIKFDSDAFLSDRVYQRLATYQPNVGDRIEVLKIENKYLILGKVV